MGKSEGNVAMASKIREYVNSFLLITNVEQIIKDWEKYEEDGQIGTSELRTHAENVMKICSANKHVVWWMRELAFECYRSIAKQDKEWRIERLEKALVDIHGKCCITSHVDPHFIRFIIDIINEVDPRFEKYLGEGKD